MPFFPIKSKRTGPMRGAAATRRMAAAPYKPGRLTRLGGGGSGGSAQGQLQVRRNQASSTQHQAPTPMNDQQETQGGFLSMDEINADLQKLDEQQQETARKKEIAKHTLTQSKEKEESVQDNLRSLKYSNGQLRQRLDSNRGLLSLSNHELNATDRAGKRTGADVSAFDAALNKGVIAVRINQEYRRKIEAQLTFAFKKVDILKRLRNEALKKPLRLEKARDEVKHKLDHLRRDISAAAIESREYRGQVAKERADMGVLEQELAEAQRMEATTNTSAQGLDQEIEVSVAEHAEGIEAASLKIKEAIDAKAAGEVRGCEMHYMIDKVKQQANTLHERLSQMQGTNTTEDGAGTKTVPSDGEESSSAGLGVFESALKKEEVCLSQIRKEKHALLESIESLETNEMELQKQEEAVQSEITETSKSSQMARAEEAERRKHLEKTVEEFDNAKKDLEGLKKAYAELNEKWVADQAGKGTTDSQESLQQLEKEIATLKDQLSTKQSSTMLFNETWPQEKAEMKAELKKLKRDAIAAGEERNSVAAALKNASSTEEHLPLEQEKQDNIDRAKAADEKIAVLLADHKELEDVPYTYDPESTTAAQTRVSLDGLMKSCKNAVDAARDRRRQSEAFEKTRKEQTEKERRRKEKAKQAQKQKEAEHGAAKQGQKEEMQGRKHKVAAQGGKEKPRGSDGAAKIQKRQAGKESMDMDTSNHDDFTQPDFEPFATPKQKTREATSPFESRSTGKRVHWKNEESDDESIPEPEPESQVSEPTNQAHKSKSRRQFGSTKPKSKQVTKREQPRKTSSDGNRRGSRDSKSIRGRSKSPSDGKKQAERRQKKDCNDGGVLAGSHTKKDSSKSSSRKSDPSVDAKGHYGISRASESGGGRKHTKESNARKQRNSSSSDQRESVLTTVSTSQQSSTKKKHRLSVSAMSSKSKHSSHLQAKQDTTKNSHRRSSSAKGSGSGRAALARTSSHKMSSSASKKRKTKTAEKPRNVRRKQKKEDIIGVPRKKKSPSLGADIDFTF